MNEFDWLNSERTIARSKKSYSHFDHRTDISKVKKYINNSDNIVHHGFYPFIHYRLKSVKYSALEGKTAKSRDICYASHVDRCIYQFYSFKLNILYNERVKRDGLASVAVAYRTDLHKNNVHLAKEAIDYIKNTSFCYIMIGDFTGFFDNIDHQYLKRQWCSLLNEDNLPGDHYAIFKNITKYSKWELSDLLKINNLEDTREGRIKLNSLSVVLTKSQYKENRSQIVKNKDNFGIPQGSPISAVLANIYMLEADKKIYDLVTRYNGMYMRYSDDFLIVLPDLSENDSKNVFEMVASIINSIPRLELQPNKTQYFNFENNSITNCGSIIDSNSNKKSKLLNFLGFSFDGQNVTLRAKTISKYYYRMYRKAKVVSAIGNYPMSGRHTARKKLYNRYSEKGSSRNGGNFLTYVDRAASVFGEDEFIRRDTRRHMSKIRKALDKNISEP